jgi:hypothetical protein
MGLNSCFKGCISRKAVKSSIVLEATHQFISGLPPGDTLNGVIHNTIRCTRYIRLPPGDTLNGIIETFFLRINEIFDMQGRINYRIYMGEKWCFKGCISRKAVKSSNIVEATHQFISGLPPGDTLNGVIHNIILRVRMIIDIHLL